MGGVYNGDPSVRDDSHHGAEFSIRGPVFAIGEVGYRINGLPRRSGPAGQLQDRLLVRPQPVHRLHHGGTGPDPPRPRGANWGIYGQFDQVLVRFGGNGSIRGLGITASVLVSPDQSREPDGRFFGSGRRPWSGGLLPARPKETCWASASSTATSAPTCRTRNGASSRSIRPSACRSTRIRASS